MCLDGNLMACPYCPGNSLDPLGYHCVTCKRGGDVTLRHNALHNVLFNTFRRAGLSYILRLVVAGVRRVQGPVQQTF